MNEDGIIDTGLFVGGPLDGEKREVYPLLIIYRTFPKNGNRRSEMVEYNKEKYSFQNENGDPIFYWIWVYQDMSSSQVFERLIESYSKEMER